MTWRIITADALEGLRSLPDESVHCCVTSPPYWGLRDYGTAEWEGGEPDCDHRHDTEHQKQGATSARRGRANAESQRNENFRDECGKCGARRVDQQLGLEPTPEEYVARMVEVFREVRRVLREDGTLWLVLGDSYAGNRSYQVPDSKNKHHVFGVSNALGVPHGLKAKDLVGIPWRVAFALQADGWYLRSDIIWVKPNPMPESVQDRPTKSHEYLFLLSKSERYFWDQEAVREGDAGTDHPRNILHQPEPSGGLMAPNRGIRKTEGRNGSGRNIRSVWTIATQPFPEAHFATFPPELPRRCILAGTSERGCCPECGAPWERVVELTGRKICSPDLYGRPRVIELSGNGETSQQRGGQPAGMFTNEKRTTGWRPTCTHEAEPVPCTVLDPFTGSGTTGMVARQLGRHFIGIELSPEYAAMAERRIGEADVGTVLERGGKMGVIAGPLFDEPIRDINHPSLEATRRRRKESQ